jgi:hypothetical protein
MKSAACIRTVNALPDKAINPMHGHVMRRSGAMKIFVLVSVAHLYLAVATQACAASDGERHTGKVTYSSPTQKYSYSLRGYQVSNDAWGAGKLVEGVDYSTSVTFDPDDFQAGTFFSWRYPRNVGGVYAYPHIDYDVHAAGVNSTRAANIGRLSASYNANLSDLANSTVAFDLWFNSQPNGPWITTSAELLIEVHPTSRPFLQRTIARLRRLFRGEGDSDTPFVLTGSGVAGATVHVANTSAANASWKFIDVKIPKDMMSGTLSLSGIIKELLWDGVLTGQDYLASLQFGSEVQGGTGSLQLNGLSYEWADSPTLVGTPGNDTFVMNNGEGSYAVGNGGVDTAVYGGPFSDYQIKSVGSQTLVIKANEMSNLDQMQGVSFVKFSDGIYNTATRSFELTPGTGNR